MIRIPQAPATPANRDGRPDDTPTLIDRDADTLRRRMILCLGLVDLDDADLRFLDWLAARGPETADRFTNLVSKIGPA